jgi:hypothetical protein
MTKPFRRYARLALAGYVALLAVVLLDPSPAAPTRGVGWLHSWSVSMGLPITAAMTEFALNALVFVPIPVLGAAIHGSAARAWSWAGAAAAGSVAVECVQALVLGQRSGSVVDVVANSLGAGLGAVLATVLFAMARRNLEESTAAPSTCRSER